MLAWLFGGLVTLLGGGLYARHWLRTRLAAPRLPVVGTPSSHGLAGRTVEIPTARVDVRWWGAGVEQTDGALLGAANRTSR